MTEQHTLREALEFSGVGLHTGAPARVVVHPAAARSGIRFALDGGQVEFAATAENVVETRMATVVGSGEARVSTVEHILSGLSALGVDNARLEVEGPEIPILDGSSATFCAAIERIGLEAQATPRAAFAIDRPMVFRDGDAMLAVAPADEFRVRFAVEFAPPVGAQYLDATIEPEFYLREISAARTFGYLRDVEALRARGLARGGSLDNALVFDDNGPLTPLRWPNEVVRHKVLDLIGDFALLGAWPKFEVLSVKSGHKLHALAARELRAAFGPKGA